MLFIIERINPDVLFSFWSMDVDKNTSLAEMFLNSLACAMESP